MNKEAINYPLIEQLFKLLEPYCTIEGIKKKEMDFKSYHSNRLYEREYISGSYDETNKVFRAFEQVGIEEYKDVLYSFEISIEKEFKAHIKNIEKHFAKFYGYDLLIDSNLDTELRNLLDSNRERLIKKVENINTYTSIKSIIKNNLQRINLPKSPIHLKVKNSSKNLDIPNGFFSDKLTPAVVEVLYEKLVSGDFIERCNLNHFQKIFYTKPPVKSSIIKSINWIGKIGVCRYFILKMEQAFFEGNPNNFNSQKWQIAEMCFTINGKFYQFSKKSNKGKNPHKNEIKKIDEIISIALQQYQIK